MVCKDNIVVLGPDPQPALSRAVQWLLDGGVVGMPTESVYGLAVCADNAHAVARLCALKGREPHKPLPLIAAAQAHVLSLCDAGPEMQRLMKALWPGPLTLGLRPKQTWPKEVLAADGTLGIRVSAHPLLQALCSQTSRLLTATSANLAGEPPVQSLHNLPTALKEGVLWLDGGVCAGGPPSTVVVQDAHAQMRIARRGAVTLAELQQVLGAHVLQG